MERLVDGAGADVRARPADLGERLRRRRQAREHHRREHDRPTISATSTRTVRRSRRGAGLGQAAVAALERRPQAGRRARVVDAAGHERGGEQGDLDEDRLAVARLPQRGERGQVQDRRADAASRSRAAPRRPRPARSAARRARAPPARRRRRANAQDQEPGQAAEPERPAATRCVQSSDERQGRGRRLGGVPGQARDGQRRGRREQRPGQGQERRRRPLPAGAVVDPERDRGRRPRTAPGPARGLPNERPRFESRTTGTVAPRSSPRPLREPRRRDEDVDRDRDQRDHERHAERDRDRAAGPARRRPRPGRAISARIANRPTASSMLMNTSQRVATSWGVAADSESDGITNWGGGAGVGPDRERERAAHRVAVGRDHPPVDEVPALGQVPDRHRDRVGIRRRARAGERGRLLLPGARR